MNQRSTLNPSTSGDARRALLAAIPLGILADPLLRDGLWGVGLTLWMVAFAAAVILVVRRSRRSLSPESGAWLAVAVLLAGGLSWRDADVLQVFDILAMLAALVLLAMSLDAIPVGSLALARVRDLVRAAFGTGIAVATGAVPLVLNDAEFNRDVGAPGAPGASSAGNAGRIGRAIAITVPILIVFTLLLANADPIFGSLVRFPDIDWGIVASHVMIAGFFAWVVAGWLRRSVLARPGAGEAPATTLPLTLGATDVAFALGALNLLFAAFVVVQIGWLFGGQALVLRTTGLSYAEYARRGFFELLWVAGLVLPVLLGAQALIADSDARTIRSYRRLAALLLVLLAAIMVSAGARMRLYIHYYGISTDRLYASAFMIWLAIVFAWLALTVLRSRPRTFAMGLVVSGFGMLFALNVLNPDALVARANLARGDGARSGVAGSDLKYVAALGGDAVPLVVSALTSGQAAGDSAAVADRCAAAKIVLDRWTGEKRGQTSSTWNQWNVARSRASEAVRAHEAELRRLACAATSNRAAPPPISP